MILAVVVTAASAQDRDGAKQGLEGLRRKFSRLRHIWADGAYAGALVNCVWSLRPWRKVGLEITKRTYLVETLAFLCEERYWPCLGCEKQHKLGRGPGDGRPD